MFCKYSTDLSNNKSTLISNYFITECMPYSNDKCVKVYLYGLYKCQNGEQNNTIKDFATELNMTQKDVENAFWYWQQEGLVRIIEQNPIEVIYLNPKDRFSRINRIDENKYEDFVLGVQSYFEGVRQVLPTELNAYIDVVERFKMEQMAMLRIIKYCIEYKSKDVGYPYIIQVAKNWAYSGILNLEAVENKINELGLTDEKLNDILKTLGLRRSANLDERQLYFKWTNTFGFTYETIMSVAKSQKRKGGINKLDTLLTTYFEKRLFSEKEILEYEENRTKLFTTAKNVAKNLGKYYEVLDNVIDTYILPWKNKGFDEEIIELIATLCFKSSINTLEGMDNYIQKLFKLGITNEESLSDYMQEIKSKNDKISVIFEKLGINRKIRNADTLLYDTWTKDWKMEGDLLLHLTSLALDKDSPLAYYNKLLASYNEKGIYNLELYNANKSLLTETKTSQNAKSKLKIYEYTSDELNAMFDNLDEVEI